MFAPIRLSKLWSARSHHRLQQPVNACEIVDKTGRAVAFFLGLKRLKSILNQSTLYHAFYHELMSLRPESVKI
jgi:hypothetical protein